MPILHFLLATSNDHKVFEIQTLLGDTARSVYSLKTIRSFYKSQGWQTPDPKAEAAIEETGDTFYANARIKAEGFGRLWQCPTLADDSGLCVDALGGEPGVYSARYAGYHASDKENNNALLQILDQKQITKPSAHFTCVMYFFDPTSNPPVTFHTEGRVDGIILDSPCGDQGFGYDPLFWLPNQSKTLAELPIEQKNRISHRSQALRAMVTWIQQVY
jgi:XTP/dITP diphosphohydrolase